MTRSLFPIFFLLISVLAAGQQQEVCKKSTEGKDFWFGFMESRNYNPNHFLEITVTARESANFHITIGPEEEPFNGTYTVNSNASVQVKIPWDVVEPIGSEEAQPKGIHLVADNPVNVYALNWDQNSSDVAVIYPVESLGQEYFAMCYYPDIDMSNPYTGNGRNSEFLVVATQDSTSVAITPSKVTDHLVPKDSTFSVWLNRGKVYQVQSENIPGTDNTGQGDLTGSYINTNKPVAFYSGSLSTTIPEGVCCWDHLYEQIPPLQAWGREYFAVPLKSREQDRYRILASEDNTTVQITGRQDILLNRGEFVEVVFYYNDPKRIFADKPIMVAQFSQSRDIDRDFNKGNGDPFMIILSSTKQTKNDVTFVAYQSPNIDVENYYGIEKYFVNIISLASEVSNIRFDGQQIQDQFHPFPGGNYSYAQIETDVGTHRIFNTNKDRGFLAYVYGFGGVESYGYGVGFNLDLILDLGESIFFGGDTLLLCYGSNLTLDAGPYFDKYEWNTGSTEQSVNVTEQGWYWAKTATNDGCQLEDSVYVFVSHPKTDLGANYEEGCAPITIHLDGKAGFETYLWQNEFGDTLSTDRFYDAFKTGVYRLTVSNQYQCTDHDTMQLVVHPVPEVKIEGSHLICGKKSTQLSVSITGTAEDIWNFDGSYEWSANRSGISLSEKTQTSVKINTADWGDFDIYYWLKTIDDCEITDTFHIRFHPQPVSSFNFEDDEKCKGYSRILSFDGEATDSALFYWDLGGCQFTDTLGWQVYNVSVGAFVTKQPSVLLYIDDGGCISDTVSKPIGAEPNFEMKADPTRGCDELTVNFSSSLKTEDQVDFVWTFDDSVSVNQQNVTRYYPIIGFYKVNLTITNKVTQCQNGFTLDSMVRVYPTPVAKIYADPNECYPDTAQLFYINNIDSSLCTWELEGMHQIGDGNDSVNVVFDNPFGKAKLTVDEYGCISEPAEIMLKRKPLFDLYTESNEGCQPFSPEFFADTKDDQLEFSWITDSLPYPNGSSHLYSFPDTGKFTISLAAYSMQTGCTDTLIKPDLIWVHPNPISKFEVDYPVALLEHSDLQFTNYSSHAVNYLWDFGDGQTTDEFEPYHNFTELGNYNVKLTAESQYGCIDSSAFVVKTLPFKVFSPNAFRPNSAIPENRTFMPVGTGADENRFNLRIFDRWGQVVFETNSPYNPWDGKAKNGKDAPMGNYVWVARFFDIQGYEHNQKGQVLLVR